MRFEIDPVQVRPESREEQVFKWTMLGWLQAWSQKSPTMTVTEIHTEDHPLMKNYSTDDDKFDLTKIYRDNLYYPRSSESKGLQIADMAASIMHHAVCGIATVDNLMNYGMLLKNNLWSAKHAHGVRVQFVIAAVAPIHRKKSHPPGMALDGWLTGFWLPYAVGRRFRHAYISRPIAPATSSASVDGSGAPIIT